MKKLFLLPLFFCAVILITATIIPQKTTLSNQLSGAWSYHDNSKDIVLMFIDGYCSYSEFNKADKKFTGTLGGPYTYDGTTLKVKVEFNSIDSAEVGSDLSVGLKMEGDKLKDDQRTFQREDNGTGPLAGNWRITGRMQDGKMVEINRSSRKTLKLLSGSRFQWIAINPEVKGFYGTGGGTYTFNNGKYTETIEFFSRDGSRVGASLTFDGKVENGKWHHSGKSSRGEPLNEVWSREK